MTQLPRGKTTHCLRLYGQTLPPKGDKLAAESRKYMAQFCGVSDGTAARWTLRGGVPKGSELLKLRVFLELLGYGVQELKDLSKTAYRLAELLAFGVLTVEKARQELGYKNPQDVYRIVSGGGGIVEEKIGRIGVLYERHLGQIQASRKKAEEVLLPEMARLHGLVVGDAPTVQPEVVRQIPRSLGGVSTEQAAETLAYLILAMLPLVEYFASDDCTPEDRAKVRDLAEAPRVFRASSALHALNGEHARTLVRQKSPRRGGR